VAILSTEAEYIAILKAYKKAIYFKDLLWELGYNKRDIKIIKINLNNKITINLTENPIIYLKTKYIRLRYYKVKELV